MGNGTRADQTWQVDMSGRCVVRSLGLDRRRIGEMGRTGKRSAVSEE